MNAETLKRCLEFNLDDSRFSTPYTLDDMVLSTNGHFCLFVENTHGLEYKLWDGNRDLLDSFFKKEKVLWKTLSINVLNAALEKTEKIDLFDDTPCSGCQGSGEVEWTAEVDNEYYSDDFDCPVCDGKGYTNTILKPEKGLAQYQYIDLGVCRLDSSYIKYLVDLSDILEKNEIEVYHQDGEYKPTFFGIGSITVLIMPVHKNDFETAVAVL